VANKSKRKILIIENDENISSVISTRFLSLGYDVSLSTNGAEALIIFNQEWPDLVILDILLPKIDGYEVCRQMRKNSDVPIIILSALASPANRVMGLELGADDFITKPFSLKEIAIRINSNLKRSGLQKLKTLPTRQELFYFGDLTINLTTQQVLQNNKQLILTEIEFSLLQLLIQNAGRKLSRATILDNIWGFTPERDIDTRVVDVHIHRLRSKLEENPKIPNFILTVRGIGYKFQTVNL